MRDAETLAWSVNVPIFRRGVILKQLGLAIGVPFGMLLLFLLLASGGSQRIYALYGVGLILLLFALTYGLIQAVYGGTYAVDFEMDGVGVRGQTQARQARRGRVLNVLTVVLGLLTGQPAAAGAGLLAQSRQRFGLPWARVRRVSYQPREWTILLYGAPSETVAVFCTPENYQLVAQQVALALSSEPR
jgi:hypothetical protein